MNSGDGLCGCFLHAGRKSVKNISQSILQDLQMYQWEEYSLGNNALPTVICGSCRLKLLKCKGKSDHGPITDVDYKSLIPPPLRTRSSTDRYQCTLCQKGRITLLVQPKKPDTALGPVKICPGCQGRVAQGITHVCTKTNRNNNILETVGSLSAKNKGQVLSQSQKDLSDQSGSKTINLTTKGAPLPVRLGKEKVMKQRVFSKENLKRLQNQRQFTDNDMNAIEAATRITFGRPSVQSGAREDRVEQNYSLDHLFEGRMVKLKHKPKKKKDDDDDDDSEESDSELDQDGLKDIVRPVVVCSVPQEFIYKVMMERNMDIDNTDIKIGADDGHNIFKINVQLVSKEQKDSTSKSRAPIQMAL